MSLEFLEFHVRFSCYTTFQCWKEDSENPYKIDVLPRRSEGSGYSIPKLEGDETPRRNFTPDKSHNQGDGEGATELPIPRISILTQGEEDELNAEQENEGNIKCGFSIASWIVKFDPSCKGVDQI